MKSNKKITIIAEAGVNHNGQLALARQLVEVAADAGADFVKFQAFKADKLVSKDARKAGYQITNMNDGDDRQYEMLKKLEIDQKFHQELIEFAKEQSIGFLSSPFDVDGIDMLYEMGLRTFKVPSGEITNLPYLQKLAGLDCKIILSTGMATLEEIKKALEILESENLSRDKITVLHCNTDYPTRFEDVNLRAMNTIKEELEVSVGYSDHTPGIEVPIAAAALGADVIEKHYTLDRNMEGPDHKASLEPDELKQMIQSVRNIEKALGNGIKIPSESELKNKEIVRKSIHLAHSLPRGQKIKEEDLIMLRPGDGISPMDMNKVVGKQLLTELPKSHKLKFSDLNGMK